MRGTDARAGPPAVALVTSAGGLQALTAVLGGDPADLPAADLLPLHRAPDRPNQLGGILARTTALPVEAAADEESSILFSMPSATITRDHALVVPLGEVAALIVELVAARGG